MTALARQKVLRVKDVQVSTYNPPGRTSRGRIRELVQSISRVGLLYPVLVDTHNRLIDGHRRLAAVKELGWDEIPALVTAAQRDDVYANVNSTARKMSGNEALEVWMKAPGAVSLAQQTLFSRMQADIGRAMISKIISAGLSARVYQTARRICVCCALDSITFPTARVVDWLLDVTTVGYVQKLLDSGTPAKMFKEAIERGKPLHLRPAVGD